MSYTIVGESASDCTLSLFRKHWTEEYEHVSFDWAKAFVENHRAGNITEKKGGETCRAHIV